MAQAEIGIIGGSGLYSMPGFEAQQEVEVDTPWGAPSDEILFGRLEQGGTVSIGLADDRRLALDPRRRRDRDHAPIASHAELLAAPVHLVPEEGGEPDRRVGEVLRRHEPEVTPRLAIAEQTENRVERSEADRDRAGERPPADGGSPVATRERTPQSVACVTTVRNQLIGWQTRYVRDQRSWCRHTSDSAVESRMVSTVWGRSTRR